MAEGLTRADRKAAVEALDYLADQIALAATWLDQHGDTSVSADKASTLLECCARDLSAACWLLKPADHSRPEGWLDGSRAMRG